MKAKKGSDKTQPSEEQELENLPPKKTSEVKGGSAKLQANAHEMKKALIGNLPR